MALPNMRTLAIGFWRFASYLAVNAPRTFAITPFPTLFPFIKRATVLRRISRHGQMACVGSIRK
jgi:hypothetical protein